MLATEIERSHDSSDVRPPRGRTPRAVPRALSRALHLAARVLGVLAAFLAFGLLGALVGCWHVARGRKPADHTCRGCRQRARLVRGGTFLLAGLVLLGSGMAVDQQAGDSGLPPCSAESPELTSGWHQARQVVTAPVSGLVRGYVHDRGGGLCEAGSMTLALLPAAASDSGVAVGSVVLTGDESPIGEEDGAAMARHESRHVTQWAASTLAAGPLAMPLLYALDDTFFPTSRNHFERAAGLEDGGYPHPDGTGPRPDRVKLLGLGLCVLLIGRRRLRWASRVLTGGRAGAMAHQRGFCPVHSTGWFRVTACARPTASGEPRRTAPRAPARSPSAGSS